MIEGEPKVPFYVDGVDVNSCKFFLKGYCSETLLGGFCTYEPECYFKQLMRTKEKLHKTEETLRGQRTVSECLNTHYWAAVKKIQQLEKKNKNEK